MISDTQALEIIYWAFRVAKPGELPGCSLQNTPAIADYHGCGRGWLELDNSGTPRRMRYSDCLDRGETEQNIDCSPLHTGQYRVVGDRVRVLCNFSCTEAVLG